MAAGTAGFAVWKDSERLTAGSPLATALPDGLEQARSAIFCVSKSWTASTWCEDEFGAALQEKRKNRQFTIIGLILDDSPAPKFISNTTYISCKSFDAEVAFGLIRSLRRNSGSSSRSGRDVYLSRGWHTRDAKSADLIGELLAKQHGYRVIGDFPEFTAFDENLRA